MRHDLKDLHVQLQKFVCPIFSANRKSEPELVGSGVLLRVSSRVFLLTAAHILDENERTNFYVSGKSELIELLGRSYYGVSPGSGRRRDKIDVGFVLLSDAVVGELYPRLEFLAVDNLNVNDIAIPGNPYAFVGYPTTRNKPRLHHKIRLGGMMLTLAAATEDKYVQLGLSSSTHLVACFDRSRVAGQAGRTAPDPHGMSGGGVWRLERSPDFAAPQVFASLVALAIEWRRTSRVLVAVRISILVAMLRRLFPDIASQLCEPSRVGVRVTLLSPDLPGAPSSERF